MSHYYEDDDGAQLRQEREAKSKGDSPNIIHEELVENARRLLRKVQQAFLEGKGDIGIDVVLNLPISRSVMCYLGEMDTEKTREKPEPEKVIPVETPMVGDDFDKLEPQKNAERSWTKDFERKVEKQSGRGGTRSVPTNQQLIDETRTALLVLIKNVGKSSKRRTTNLGSDASSIGQQTDAIEVMTTLLSYLEDQVARGRT